MSRTILLAALTSFALALVIVRLLCSKRLARLVVDVPNDRSLHTLPTPRTGGLGLMLAAALAWWIFAAGTLPVVAGLAGLLALVFLIDDVCGLPVLPRFGAQFATAIAFVTLSGPYPALLSPLLILGIVWVCNLYNFMDGSNGFAGGMSVFGFASYAIAAYLSGAGDVALVVAIVAGAAAGFLMWNFDPARIFLGDAGSIPLGFLAAAIGVIGWRRGVWPFWLPLLVFAPFVIDATVTLIQRARRHEKVWEAHRTHYYQRLVQSGWSHRQLAVAAYAVMAAASASALALRNAHPVAVIALLLAWAAVFAGIALAIDYRWDRFHAAKSKELSTAEK